MCNYSEMIKLFVGSWQWACLEEWCLHRSGWAGQNHQETPQMVHYEHLKMPNPNQGAVIHGIVSKPAQQLAVISHLAGGADNRSFSICKTKLFPVLDQCWHYSCKSLHKDTIWVCAESQHQTTGVVTTALGMDLCRTYSPSSVLART